MNFTEIYQTTDRFDFYEVTAYLEANNVEFQKLHEYRLHGELNLTPNIDPAIIRVKENEAEKVKMLLMEGGFMETNTLQNINAEFSETSYLDLKIFRDKVDALTGKVIIEVSYVIANEIDYDYDNIHSFDFGIILKFNNGKHLWWHFKEGEPDFENDIYIPQQFELELLNEPPNIDSSFKIINVSDNENWNKLIGQPLSKLSIFTQLVNTHKVVTDLILETSKGKAALYSTPEPTENEEQVNFSLEISNEWAIVVFDEELIDSSGRTD